MSKDIEETIRKMARMTPETFAAYVPGTKAEEIAQQIIILATQGDKSAIQIVFDALKSKGDNKTEIKIVEK